MWINIDIVPKDEEIVYVPRLMADKLSPQVNILFGDRNVPSTIRPVNDIKLTGGRTFENPQKIGISLNLAAKLQIPKSLTYRMKFNKDNILIGPVIGLLLGDHNHLYNPEHMEKYSDRFGIYDKIGGLIYAFSPRAVDWKNRLVYGLYYNKKKSVWRYGRFPLPSAIYRRDFHSDPETTKKLIEITQGKLFNAWRFSKYFLYNYVRKNKELSEYLPPTERSYNYEQVKKFIDDYNDVILKPVNLSRGRGICIIKKHQDIYKISDYRSKDPVEIELSGDESLKRFFEVNKEFFDEYIIQKYLSLAKIGDSHFDVRVVMQKEKPSEWKCTGIECRVAAPKNLVTNISRGGYALTINEALRRAFPGDSEEHKRTEQQIVDLCRKLCEYLDEMGYHFAEFGMDIAIDRDKNLWIIEVNVFPSFKGFKVMDYNTYLDIRYTPIQYAAYLAGF